MAEKREMDQPLAIRIMHWIHALSIILLAWSGMYIHYPGDFAFPGAMNGARFIHFLTMYIVTINLVVKVYHALVTGYYKQIWFYARHFRDLTPLVKYYLWMAEVEPKEGHLNPGQRMMYSMWFFLLIFEALTGFALYPLGSFQWVGWVLQGLGYVRMLHFLGAWLFIVTTVAHVYLGLYHGVALLRGIITGYEEKKA